MHLILSTQITQSRRRRIFKKLCIFISLNSLAFLGCAGDLNERFAVDKDLIDGGVTDSDSASIGDMGTDTNIKSDTETLPDDYEDSDAQIDSETTPKPDTATEFDSENIPDSESGSQTESAADNESDSPSDSEPGLGSDSDSHSTTEQENTHSACSDGEDNDSDGLPDCADPECLETGACQCLNGTMDEHPCGLCGEVIVTCIDGNWVEISDCEGEGVCEPGKTVSQDCGPCQKKSQTCKNDCTWGGWSTCDPIPGCLDCDGVVFADLCWYLGDFGKSCQDVCSSHGGYKLETSSYVGNTDQGGTREKCEGLFHALGYPGEVSTGNRPENSGLGCHRWKDGKLWWLPTTLFNPSHFDKNGQVVCACKK